MGAIAPKEDAKGGRFLMPFAQWVLLLRNGCYCSELCKKCGRKFTFGSLTAGIVVNIIVAFVIDALLTFIPFIGWLGTSFIVYLQFYSSGKGFIETLRSMDIG